MDLPWKRPELADWRIVGMNHYRQNGAERLYVAMTSGVLVIQAEGPDGPLLWDELARKAGVRKRPLPVQVPEAMDACSHVQRLARLLLDDMARKYPASRIEETRGYLMGALDGLAAAPDVK